MTREYQALFALVRAGLWDRYDEAMASAFPLSSESWERVFDLARRQTVTGVTFRGLDFLPEEVSPPMGLTAKWMAYADRIEQGNRKVNSVLSRMCAHFAESGAKVVLQKGPGVAAMYPEPYLREFGDIDLFFPDCGGESDPLEGIPCAVKEARPDASWEYVVGGVVVERHTYLVDIQSPRAKKYVAGLIEEKGYESLRIDGCEVLVPAPEVNLLLLSAHILKHAFGVGIGLRQLCDMAVACRYYSDRVNRQEMHEIYRQAGLEKWSGLLEGFLAEYLGLEAEGTGEEKCSKKSRILLDIILKGGNFGRFKAKKGFASEGSSLRMLRTLESFLGNTRFALTYAPGEWFWTMAQLAGGRIR